MSSSFNKLFANPPNDYRGMDIIHFFGLRYPPHEVWHDRPADPTRTLQNLGPAFKNSPWYGEVSGADPEPNKGIRGDVHCCLPGPAVLPQATLQAFDQERDCGVAGFVSGLAWSPQYPYGTSKDWGDLEKGLEYSRQNGLSVWLYDEEGYPSGHGNQRVCEDNPEYLAQGLHWTIRSIENWNGGDMGIDFPDGESIAAIAVSGNKSRLNCDRQHVFSCAKKAGSTTINLPEGDWTIFSFAAAKVWKGTHAHFLNINYPNLLNSSAVRKFIDITHETYYKKCARWFGNTIKAFFTDESSLMAPIIGFNGEYGQPHIPWVDDLPEVFEKYNGYSLFEVLPALIANVGAKTIKYRCDFWETIAKLLSTRCHRQIADWCANHGVVYTGHVLWEEHLRWHVPLHGDLMENLRQLGWPGYDALLSILRDEDAENFSLRTLGAKYASSVAHLYKKPHVFCETFGLTPPRTVAIYEHVLDVLVLLGLDRHCFYSIFDKLTIEERRRLNTHLGRITVVAEYGKHRCDIAILYPIVSAWACFDASNQRENPGLDAVDKALITLSEGILDHQMDFDFCDDSSLCQGHALNGRWQMGDESYKILLIPPMLAIRKTTLDTLLLAQKSGVEVIFTDCFPSATAENGEEITLPTFCESNFMKPVPCEKVIDMLVELAGLKVCLMPDAKQIWVCHRRKDSPATDEWSDIFFAVNTRTSSYEGSLTLPAIGQAYLCDISTGCISMINPIRCTNGSMTINLKLDGLCSQVIAFK